MKSKPLRAFIEELVAARGGRAEPRGDNLIELSLPEEAEAAIGATSVLFAFNLRGVQEDPTSELATVGNPLFDRLLDHARHEGRVGERFRAAAKPPARPPDPSKHFRFTQPVAFGLPSPSYAPLYFFLFRAEYSLEDHADELEVVPLDGESLEPLGQTPELIEFWEGLSAEPAPGRMVRPAFPVPESTLRGAVTLLEKRLRKRIGKIRRDSDDGLARETRNIETYYRQLIEESRNTGRRWALTSTQREERIRVLQLDWKRRVEEANRHWRPRIEVRLTSAAAAMLPRLCWEVTVAPGPRRTGAPTRRRPGRCGPDVAVPHVSWDETEKRFVDPACPACGRTPAVYALGADGALSCPECAAPTPEPRAKGRRSASARALTRLEKEP